MFLSESSGHCLLARDLLRSSLSALEVADGLWQGLSDPNWVSVVRLP
jgi:hypothetical protein